ncbi:PRC-barrel domain-containing protein [Jiella avicenniae]|uniref:PRC-barrel domain-containing protein n=1 Tax=Jiella avicenniae TaxID=2907202 RepID=A0A9X1T5X2_9HYPH|nr:PRC-barrel domain-containing protein [Jiella avicenniae]MCE7029652.1 PRC-barrel domain-containing protein [Jiella avicenniae]
MKLTSQGPHWFAECLESFRFKHIARKCETQAKSIHSGGTSMFIKSKSSIAAVIATFLASTAFAQNTNDANSASAQNSTSGQNQGIVSLPDWHPDLSNDNSMSADAIIDMDVIGQDGEDIGDVENILFGTDGRALSIIAEVGGIWDIGDTHVSVPWDEADFDMTAGQVRVPIMEDNVDDYSIFDREIIGAETASSQITDLESGWFSETDTGPRVWRVTELIDDYARYQGENSWTNYGYVDDVMISNGELSAVVIRPDMGTGIGNGYYTYPFYGYDYGWSPGLANYDLPYDQATIENRQAVDM